MMLIKKSQKELIIDLKNSDFNAFNYFYRTYYSRLFKFANSYIKDDFTTGNIVQDTFLNLWENRDTIDPNINLPAYLLVTIKNKSLNHLNRLTIKARVDEQLQNQAIRELEFRCTTLQACNPEELFQADIQKIINETINTLPKQCKKVIQLSRFDGLSNAQISLKLGISIKTVEFHITKALKILKLNLKDYFILFLVISRILSQS